MKNELDSKLLLRVYEKVKQHGERKDDAHVLEGIKAYTDFDGYTLYVEDALVKLSFGFHNQYHFDYESSSHLEAFEKKLKYIDSNF
ncbi:DUF3081 domain-containing protein [Ningiella sp. W23]|uniref:DUF3081 domain-containing protein n=1 Tax=Ningiella sp. W23 TaxID=3023715 RepID=UPI00375715C2